MMFGLVCGGIAFVLCVIAMALPENFLAITYTAISKIGGILLTLVLLYSLASLIIIFLGGYSWSSYWAIAKYALTTILILTILAVIVKRGVRHNFRK
jgi:hypothetical protein